MQSKKSAVPTSNTVGAEVNKIVVEKTKKRNAPLTGNKVLLCNINSL